MLLGMIDQSPIYRVASLASPLNSLELAVMEAFHPKHNYIMLIALVVALNPTAPCFDFHKHPF